MILELTKSHVKGTSTSLTCMKRSLFYQEIDRETNLPKYRIHKYANPSYDDNRYVFYLFGNGYVTGTLGIMHVEWVTL